MTKSNKLLLFFILLLLLELIVFISIPPTKKTQLKPQSQSKLYYYKKGDKINVYNIKTDELITHKQSIKINNFWTKVHKYNYQTKTITEKEKFSYIYEKYLPLEKILSEISIRNYHKTKYNCIDMSEDMQSMLKKQNIESSLIVGHAPEYHQWIAVWFDSTSGYFIDPADNYKFEQIVNKNHWNKYK